MKFKQKKVCGPFTFVNLPTSVNFIKEKAHKKLYLFKCRKKLLRWGERAILLGQSGSQKHNNSCQSAHTMIHTLQPTADSLITDNILFNYWQLILMINI